MSDSVRPVMDFPMRMTEAIQSYDVCVEEIARVADDKSAATSLRIKDLCQKLCTICHVLLQVDEQDSRLFSKDQIGAICTTLEHAGAILDRLAESENAADHDFDFECFVRWERETFTIHRSSNESKDEEDKIIDCWTDRGALEEEEAMLLAMASTPVPSENCDSLSVKRNKRAVACLDNDSPS
jgi:hypothetical protein